MAAAAGATAEARVGTELAGYSIEALLGRGGMRAVYLARDPWLERKVALKYDSAFFGAAAWPELAYAAMVAAATAVSAVFLPIDLSFSADDRLRQAGAAR